MIGIGLTLALMQAPTAGTPTVAPPLVIASYPFAVGEKLSYSAKLGMLTLGSGTLTMGGKKVTIGASASLKSSLPTQKQVLDARTPLLARR